jgi:K319-like protein
LKTLFVSPSALVIASLLMLGTLGVASLFTFNFPSAFAQPSCENNGHNVLGTGKQQILKQSIHCVITENNNNGPTTGTCPPNSVLQNGVCIPTLPIAMGPDQTVRENTTVTLDGSGSHATVPGATIESYSWSQLGGNPIALDRPNTATPTFTAPTVLGPTDIIFSLTVVDSLGSISQPSDVIITVTQSK